MSCFLPGALSTAVNADEPRDHRTEYHVGVDLALDEQSLHHDGASEGDPDYRDRPEPRPSTLPLP